MNAAKDRQHNIHEHKSEPHIANNIEQQKRNFEYRIHACKKIRINVSNFWKGNWWRWQFIHEDREHIIINKFSTYAMMEKKSSLIRATVYSGRQCRMKKYETAWWNWFDSNSSNMKSEKLVRQQQTLVGRWEDDTELSLYRRYQSQMSWNGSTHRDNS